MEHSNLRPTRIEIGLAKLDDGLREVGDALNLTEQLALPGEPERHAREGLKTLRSAVDWLEDSEQFDRAHEAIDWAGRSVRETLGCRLAFDPKSGYGQTCPVALAHTRAGMSTAIIIRESECSICGQDHEDCDHIGGREYDGKLCGRIITRAEIDHISFVSRPNHIDARISFTTVSVEELPEELGPDFQYGTPVSCDACLKPCPGMHEIGTEVSSAVRGHNTRLLGSSLPSLQEDGTQEVGPSSTPNRHDAPEFTDCVDPHWAEPLKSDPLRF